MKTQATIQELLSDEIRKPLQVGDQVVKCTGDYHWAGEVRAVFSLPNGVVYYAVAHPVETGYFVQHYARNDLRLV